MKKRKKYTSKGERVNQKVKNRAVGAARLSNKIQAWSEKRDVKITIANPDKSATNKPFIRVLARDYWK